MDSKVYAIIIPQDAILIKQICNDLVFLAFNFLAGEQRGILEQVDDFSFAQVNRENKYDSFNDFWFNIG